MIYLSTSSRRASDTFVGRIFSRLEKLQNIAQYEIACRLLVSVAFVYEKNFKLYF